MTATRLIRRLLCAALVICLLCMMALPVCADKVLYDFPEEEGEITSSSAIMLYFGIQPDQDVVLYEKEADVPYPPGELMHVATLGYAMKLITEQKLDVDTETAAYSLKLFNHYVAGTGLPTALMKFGETWTLRDLMTLCAIQGSADCAAALAQKLAGSPEEFVEGLNTFAQELGCTNSHFTNVVGVNEDGQYMSARDAVTFIRYAMQYPEVAAILQLTDWTVQPVSGGNRRSWPTRNDMIRQSQTPFYVYAVGGMIGGTPSQQCVVEYASHNGYDYMTVIMGAERKDKKGELTYNAYKDARLLLRWGILSFEHATLLHKDEPVGRVEVAGCAEKDGIALVPANDLHTVVLKAADLTAITREITLSQEEWQAPIEKGTAMGTMTLYLDGKVIGTVALVAGEEAPHSVLYVIWEGFKGVIFSPWTLALLLLIVALIVGYVWLMVRINRKHNRKWKN